MFFRVPGAAGCACWGSCLSSPVFFPAVFPSSWPLFFALSLPFPRPSRRPVASPPRLLFPFVPVPRPLLSLRALALARPPLPLSALSSPPSPPGGLFFPPCSFLPGLLSCCGPRLSRLPLSYPPLLALSSSFWPSLLFLPRRLPPCLRPSFARLRPPSRGCAGFPRLFFPPAPLCVPPAPLSRRLFRSFLFPGFSPLLCPGRLLRATPLRPASLVLSLPSPLPRLPLFASFASSFAFGGVLLCASVGPAPALPLAPPCPSSLFPLS